MWPAVLAIQAASLVELSIVIEARFGADGQGDLDLLLSLDRDQAHPARAAFCRYGKRRHRAGLKLGDCFYFAQPKWLDAPLLFIAADFSHTNP